MAARNFRQKITIQSPSSSVDSRGQITGSWTDVAVRFAHVRKMGGNEATASNQLYSTASWKVRMRWESDLVLSTDYRIKYGDQYLLIGSISNIKSRNKEYEILCSEVT
jgi:SPP1 family predicted phage head-tail adaptor